MILGGLLGAGLCAMPCEAVAAPRPSALFAPGCVLPRECGAVVFGDQAVAGEEVRVGCNNQWGSVMADANGRWEVSLPPLQAGGPYVLVIEAASGTVRVEDVLVGDVWLCAGQSNMANGMKDSLASEWKEAQQQAPDHQLRWLNVPLGRSPQPETRIKGDARWMVSQPGTLGGCSAVGWQFGRHLRQELDVPVGLVVAAWGGTQAQGWIPREALQVYDTPLVAKYDAWRLAQAKETEKENDPSGTESKPPFGHSDTPMEIYHAVIHPLVPARFTGVLWYQGEQDAGRGRAYVQSLRALVEGWRSVFRQPDLPFLIVQLPAYGGQYSGGFVGIRDAQAEAVRLIPRTALVVTIDQGDPEDIHPKAKAEVGRRAALAARGGVHGQKVAWKSPEVIGVVAEGSSVLRVQFDTMNQALKSLDDQPLRSFEVVGAGGEFKSARAEIDARQRDVVWVWSSEVDHPTVVRYAVAPDPRANLETGDGLAVGPFKRRVSE
ncbi:MAG: sialate O-acetylesterase [Candidatus Methylacidiphilales bacterium]|nr:sialate O-acetylesterase [Candidatus Methylacidiphilales bacterium]